MVVSTPQHSIGVTKAPLWFYVIAVVSLLWNIMGLLAFVIQMTMTPDAMAQMSPDQIKLYESTPAWLNFVFGFAVVSGVIGCLFLLIKKAFSYKVLLASLVAVLVQMGYVFGIQQAVAVLGTDALVMPSVVILWGIFLVWFSRLAVTKHWLT
ncbi:hypothetical protein [Shewanella xiamenensis]|uniref:hypothetical protein n=1 Tax=Shewanella xiamenensis TaxID=332186 RepID=UPI00255B39E4|nr:hypothetical protein [Shewanella xiamenensis]MDL3984320.1 hypothetical protein [Shewanella xiamenensis]